MDELRAVFQHNLKSLLNGRNMADVSAECDVSYTWLRRVASRGLPRPCVWSRNNLEKLSAYFGITIDMFWKDNSKKKAFLKMLGYPAPRLPSDSFNTPDEATEQLLAVEKFGNVILEPCCGTGSISKILLSHGYEVISRDLYDWGYGEKGRDFLLDQTYPVDAVVTNPPFNLATSFANKALECTQERKGKVALLNRLLWLEGKSRRRLFTNSPLSRVLVFTNRLPLMHRPDFHGETKRSLLCFAWFVWDWNHVGEPKLGWL